MTTQQAQFMEIVELLAKAFPILASEGFESVVKDLEKLKHRICEVGSINPSHKNSLYSVLRMMLESNTYYDSKARASLDQAFVLIEEALGVNEC